LQNHPTKPPQKDYNLKHKTLQLFQLFLVIFAFYLPVVRTNNPPLFLSLACLATAYVVGKVETTVAEAAKLKERQRKNMSKKDESITTAQALDWLMKSKNIQLLTDAIQSLLQDLGLTVSPSLHHSAIDRWVKIPGMRVTWCLKVLKDVRVLNEHWDQWEEVADFELGKGGEQRLLIIGSNSIRTAADSQQRYTSFSADSQRLLAARQVVAMTTLTLCKIYLACKKEKTYIKTIFQPIENHPGGVIRL
jgi:hypothetical protein